MHAQGRRPEWEALVMRSFLLGLFVLAAASSPAGAQEWPSRTVTIIVPFSAGSTPDGLARILANGLQQRLATTFVVENRAGASGNTGTAAVPKAAPDRHTLGVSIVGPLDHQLAAVRQDALRSGEGHRAHLDPGLAAGRAGA
jgi:tripartite-type tricarboxylate transporter receptor subunit TctC